MCGVNLWHLLGKSQQPENQEVNNKEEAKAEQECNGKRADIAEGGVDRDCDCRMEAAIHCSQVKSVLSI